MCGIAGLWSAQGAPPPRQAELEAMVATLRHRGPDGQGTHLEGPVGLAHARLSIIDLAGGAQPLANEDETVWVTFNGEIFNFVELREGLIERGHRFRTHSDTEVLVHLYEELGEGFLRELNGQFALALWDRRKGRLLLARDRVGIRPLYYSWVGRRLAFASEVKALFTLPQIPRQIDPSGLASIFSYWSVLPPASMFVGVQSLPPAHAMTVDAQGTRCWRYWDWPFDQAGDAGDQTEADAAEQLRELLIDAVRLQLRSDVPVGAYLSGGLDSSVITTIVGRHTANALRSFSLTFDDAEFDESAYQRTLVTHLGTAHSAIRVGPNDIGAAFPRLVWHAESPVVRTAPVPMMLLADSVRAAGYKVVLTGEGADEAFAGYDLFKEAKIRRWAARSPGSSARPALLRRLYPYLAHSPSGAGALAQAYFGRGLEQADQPWFAHMPRMDTSRRALNLLSPDWRAAAMAWDPRQALSDWVPEGFGRWRDLHRDQYIESGTLMSGYLLSSQGDRAAMAASIEARYPFLDHRVLEFAARLPPRMKLRGLREKRVLKQAWSGDLPPSIARRVKQPYRAPDSACFFKEGRPLPYVEECLSPGRLADSGIFDPVSVGKLLAKCRAGRAIGFGDNIALVGVLSTMLLHAQFVRGEVMA